MNPIRLKQMKERCHEVEKEITRVEAGIAECENSLQTFVNAEETRRVQEMLASGRKTFDEMLAGWEEILQGVGAGTRPRPPDQDKKNLVDKRRRAEKSRPSQRTNT